MINTKWLYLIVGAFIMMAIFYLVKCPNHGPNITTPVPMPPNKAHAPESIKVVIRQLDTIYKRAINNLTASDTNISYELTEEPQYTVVHDDSSKYITIIDSLKQEVARINDLYLTRAPRAPKLLSGGFNKQTISLNMLKPDGSITGDIYDVDFDNYSYLYDSLGMHTIPVIKTQKLTKQALRTEAYGSVDYDPFHQYTTVSADYLVTYRRYSLYTRVGLKLGPVITSETKIGFRLQIK